MKRLLQAFACAAVLVSGGAAHAQSGTDGASNHDAHPSVGRRQLLQHQGSFFVKTEILCQARKAACDRLHGDYQLLDQRMTEAIRAGK